MENRIEISTNSLHADYEKIQSNLSAVTKQLQALQQEMDALNAMWEGPANAAFRQTIADDFQNLEGVCKGLEKYLGCLAYAEREYKKCENSVAETVNAIRI